MPGTPSVGHGQGRAVDELCVAQIEIYFSILQRKVLTPADIASLDQLEANILAFQADNGQVRLQVGGQAAPG
jgi:hypothetical protein